MTQPPDPSHVTPERKVLSATQRRVLGALIEKAKTTPAGYPMSVNAIVAGCNQKSNRDPVTAYDDFDVEKALGELQALGVVKEIDWLGRVAKYKHLGHEWLGVRPVELAILTELMLRGPQSLGDLRARAARMEPIEDLTALKPIVEGLVERKLMIELTPPGRGQIVSHNLYEPEELAGLRGLHGRHATGAAPAVVAISSPQSGRSIEIGQVEAIFRYPVKSMGGERLDSAQLGWHGLDGDRRLAFRKMDDRGGFPWLSASKCPDLLRFAPHRRVDGAQGELPTHVRTPDGQDLPIFGEDLATKVGRRLGAPVQMMQLNHGIFDEATISVIASDTVREIGRLAGQSPDVRRFRPNVLVRLLRPGPFQEDEWVGGVLSFGAGDDAPAVGVTMRDIRCSMVNFDPDTAGPAPEMLKAVVRVNQNTAGVYGTVLRIGRLSVGQAVLFHSGTEK